MQFKCYVLSFLFSLAKCAVSINVCIGMTHVPCIFFYTLFIVFCLQTAVFQKEVAHCKWRALTKIIFMRKIITPFSSRKWKKFHFIMILQPPSTLNIRSCLCHHICECRDFSRYPGLLSQKVHNCSWLQADKVDSQYSDLLLVCFFWLIKTPFLFPGHPFCKSLFTHSLKASYEPALL